MVEITGGNIAAILTYATNIFNDMENLLPLVIGLPLGFWVFRKVVGLVRAR